MLTDGGFQFQLRNHLGSGYARRVFPLTLDGQDLAMSGTRFEVDGKVVEFEMVDSDRPFTLGMNKTTTITYVGGVLEPGPHTIGMRFEVAGLGELGFDFSDVVEDFESSPTPKS